MRAVRLLALAALSLSAACDAADVTSPAATPAEPSRVTVPPAACVTFDPPPWGTLWGVPAGHVPGSLVHTENSIDVTVEPIAYGGATWFNVSRLEPDWMIGWGSLNSLHMVDIGTKYHFMNYGGWVPTTVKIHYQDLGAGPDENLEVNGQLYIGDIALAPPVLGGATVTLFPGWVVISGAPINDVLIGGQDLRVDDVCAAP